MLAIYKKEVRSYLTSMIGYVFIAFALLFAGIYFSAYLSMGYAYFSYTLQSIAIFFIVLIPILTMRVIAEENKQKTDQLILTAPVSVGQVVLGKYLAVVTMLAIPVIVMCFYPLILAQYGTVDFGSTYISILGFFLLQCAQIAIGVFFSSVTESQIIAAVMTFGALFISYMMSSIVSLIPSSAFTAFCVYAIVILVIAYLIYTLLKNVVLACVLGVIGEAVLIGIYVLQSSLLEGSLANVLEIFNLTNRFYTLSQDLLDFNSIVYFLAVIIFFLYLTTQSIQKRRWS